MQTLVEALAFLPEKYVADFNALFQDPLFQNQPDSQSRMVIPMRILRQKKEQTSFCVMNHSLPLQKARSRSTENDRSRDY
jgi:hypothetical protein